MAGARDRIVQSAEKHLSRGKLDQALKEYLRLLDGNPKDVFALNKAGDICVRIGRPADAIGHFERIAEVYGGDGFFLKAIAIYKKINKIDPTRLDVYEKLADLYTRQGLTQDARSHYQALAELHLKKNDIPGGIAAYAHVAALDPTDLKVQGRLAELHRVIGQIGPAVARYDAIAAMLQKRGAVEEALAVYRKVLELDPNDTSARIQIGRAHLGTGDFASAIALLEAGPRTLETRTLLAEARLARGDLAAAAAAAEEAVQADEGDERARALLGRIRLEQGRPDAALEAVAPLVEVALSLGDFPRALSQLQPILAAYPANPAALERLAAVREAQGDIGESVTARFVLARDAEERGDPSAAVEQYRRLLAIDPTHAEAAARLAALAPTAPSPEVAPAPHPSVVRDDATAAREEAEVLSRYGLKDRAVERLRALLKRHPEIIEARERLVELMVELHNPAAAREAETLAEAYRAQGSENLAAALFARLGLSAPEAPAPMPPGDRRPAPAAPPPIEFDEFAIDLPAAPRPASAASAFDAFAAAPETPAPAARARESAGVRLTPHTSADTFGILPTELGSMIGEKMQRASKEPARERPRGEAPIDDENLFADERQFFNLAEELEKELSEEKAPAPAAPVLSGTQDDASLQDIFREFRKGVEQQLSAEDYETHYNLGIAYKEMGLLDEAIGEFQLASKAPALTIECCSLLGLCFLEKGMPQLAIKWYAKGLATPGIPETQTAGLLYDLARVYQDTGDVNLAYQTFLEVYGINTNYRDVVDRVRDLEAATKKPSRESVH